MAHAMRPRVPSRNSTSSGLAGTGLRIRPARYPPAPNAAIATRIRYRPESSCSAAEESRQVGAVEVTASPMAAPKLSNTKATAVAIRAPAIAGPHCTSFTRASSRGARTGSAMVMVFSFSARSAQAEERQDEHDDDDQTDEINDTIHGFLLNGRHGLALLRCTPASAEPGQSGESSV